MNFHPEDLDHWNFGSRHDRLRFCLFSLLALYLILCALFAG